MAGTAEPDWMRVGNCRPVPVRVFFPSNGAGTAAAIKICAGCPVKQQCLEYALANGIEHGVWGGRSERERRRIAAYRRRRRVA